MLIEFSVKNWMSYKDKTVFSMVAGRETQNQDRVPLIKSQELRVLPIAAIYGGNASGKSNLLKGLAFVKMLVLFGTRPDENIPIQRFLLDDKSKYEPTSFSITILVNEDIYEFSFSTTHVKIIEEKLVKINKSKEKILYHRQDDKITTDPLIANKQRIDLVFQATRENQLFLTSSVMLNMNDFKPIFNWFNDCHLIAPGARFLNIEQYFDINHQSYNKMNDILPKLDTGISRLDGEIIPFDSLNLHPAFVSNLEENFKNDKSSPSKLNLFGAGSNESITITKENGKLTAKKLVTMHKNVNGKEIPFTMPQESDGTTRIIDILPTFIEISNPNSKKVFIADEIDRSLHPSIMRKLFELYLNSCTKDSRAQLLFTTHNFLYMEQDLLRRDEMWVTERNSENISTIFSLGEFKIRADKDIQKCYFQNRFGGTPNITLNDDYFSKQN